MALVICIFSNYVIICNGATRSVYFICNGSPREMVTDTNLQPNPIVLGASGGCTVDPMGARTLLKFSSEEGPIISLDQLESSWLQLVPLALLPCLNVIRARVLCQAPWVGRENRIEWQSLLLSPSLILTSHPRKPPPWKPLPGALAWLCVASIQCWPSASNPYTQGVIKVLYGMFMTLGSGGQCCHKNPLDWALKMGLKRDRTNLFRIGLSPVVSHYNNSYRGNIFELPMKWKKHNKMNVCISDLISLPLSYDRGSTFNVFVGKSQLIEGMDKALLGMCVNERRFVKIPPHLGYGSEGVCK